MCLINFVWLSNNGCNFSLTYRQVHNIFRSTCLAIIKFKIVIRIKEYCKAMPNIVERNIRSASVPLNILTILV